jgi:hypothetical protein
MQTNKFDINQNVQQQNHRGIIKNDFDSGFDNMRENDNINPQYNTLPPQQSLQSHVVNVVPYQQEVKKQPQNALMMF